MGQDQIINYLVKRKGRPCRIKEMCEELEINRPNVSRACKKLYEANEIKMRKMKQKNFTEYLYYC